MYIGKKNKDEIKKILENMQRTVSTTRSFLSDLQEIFK